ncbi:MAG TPA: hypothetical protein VGP33_00625 [Chloroflexota bacterium]|nr:hypothetical protein [Chloroflexota bacterium]
MSTVSSPASVRLYRLGLSKQLRAEVIRDSKVVAWAALSGEGPPSEAVALARQWAASIGYPTPEPPPGQLLLKRQPNRAQSADGRPDRS